jgi:hypothetical protein
MTPLSPLAQASLTWKLRQDGRWLTASTLVPPEAGARVVCVLLREFANRRFTPADVSLSGEVKRFHYRSDEMTLQFRLVRVKR